MNPVPLNRFVPIPKIKAVRPFTKPKEAPKPSDDRNKAKTVKLIDIISFDKDFSK